jgi:tetratricopeptide (TPR) repeat protein
MEVMQRSYAEQRVKELEELALIRPTPNILADLAAVYFTLERTEQALPLAQAAWNKNKNPSIGMNLALILKDLGRHDDSVRVVEESYYLNPDDSYVRMGYAEGLLKAGFWKQAWPLYDNSRPTQQGASLDLRLPGNVHEWNGETLPEGHELLVISEGGTGDRFLYARWLPELTKRSINWKFYPYSELFSFFERIFPRERLVADGEQTDPTHWATAFSLPAKLDISPTELPPPLRFTATSEAIEKHRIQRPDKLPVVGLCYAAAEKFQGDRKVRSLTEGQAMRLVCMTANQIHWVSLQYGTVMPFPVINFNLKTWEDTAGLIKNLDAVVTVDTGVLHLAGGMGVPIACLLSANSCWKYLRKGKKLPLYPTATFYRNQVRGLEDAITELIFAIRNNTAW